MNKKLEKDIDLNRECLNLVRKAVYRIINALRHINIEELDKKSKHILDQLIRAVEYLEDVRYYELKIRKQLIRKNKTIKDLKNQIKDVAFKEVILPVDLWNLKADSPEAWSISLIETVEDLNASGLFEVDENEQSDT